MRRVVQEDSSKAILILCDHRMKTVSSCGNDSE